MKKQDEIRQSVSKHYTQALTPSCCSQEPVLRDETAKLGGYRNEELQALPADAVANAFGCGNPVGFSEMGEGQTVLDLGSGAGIDLLLAARKVGPRGHVVGVDMTDAMIERARRNIAASGLANVEVRKGLIEELPLEDGSVDWVISNCVINLSPDKPRVFREIHRVLRPGGRMLVSDIVAEELPEDVRRDAVLYGACIGGAIGEKEYLAGLRAAGLVDAEVRERLVYDADQLEALFVQAEEGTGCCGGGGCCGGAPDPKLRDGLRALAGRVWSARVYARKPA